VEVAGTSGRHTGPSIPEKPARAFASNSRTDLQRAVTVREHEQPWPARTRRKSDLQCRPQDRLAGSSGAIPATSLPGRSQSVERVTAILRAYEEQESFLESHGGVPPPSTNPSPRSPAPSSAATSFWSRLARGALASSTWPTKPTRSTPGGPEDHQAGHGTPAGRGPLRGRAARAGDDGAPQHRQGARPPHHRLRPAYFVMEWSRRPITQYCDEHHLTPRERLELFVPFAMRSSMPIRRDHPPRHQAVERSGREYDDRPVPKIIDFGVAKRSSSGSLSGRCSPNSAGGGHDRLHESRAGQAQQLDSTPHRIYSLGVLLYELLTGETPLDRQRLRSAAFDEMLRIIREEEPPSPVSASAPATRCRRLPPTGTSSRRS